MNHEQTPSFVLAVYPFTQGFAFVFFEGPRKPFDWGVKDIRDKQKSAKTLEEIEKLIDRYRPEVLVIEDTMNGENRRTSRIRKLYRFLAKLAERKYVDLFSYKKREVLEALGLPDFATKHAIAQAVATRLPAFAHRMPPRRKAWMNADPRHGLFDAAALVVTHYQRTFRYETEFFEDQQQ